MSKPRFGCLRVVQTFLACFDLAFGLGSRIRLGIEVAQMATHLATAGIEVNCPVVAFVDDPPLHPVVPPPVKLPLPFRL